MKHLNLMAFGFVIIFVLAGLATAARSDGFTPTGSMNYPRYNHTATRLLDGRVLVVAGRGDEGLTASAELYNPATGTWLRPVPVHRPSSDESSATLLPRYFAMTNQRFNR